MKTFKSALFLAIKDILHNKRVVLLVLISLAFSFVNLLFTSSIIKGFGLTFQKQITNLYGQIIITPREGDFFIDKANRIEKKIRSLKGVSGVTYQLDSGISVRYKTKEVGTIIKGVSLKTEQDVSILPKTVVEGDYLSTKHNQQLLLGIDIADRLKQGEDDGKLVKVGEKVTIFYPNGKSKSYKIRGIIDTNNFTANNYFFINRQDLADILEAKNKASEIYVKLDGDLQTAKRAKKRIENLNLKAKVSTWKERAGYIKSIMRSIDVIRQILSGIGLIIAAIVIAVIIYINTQNKQRQIGILKAIGGQRRVVLTVFIIQSFIFAALGIVLGELIFLGINYYLHQNPLKMPFGELVPLIQNRLVIDYIIAFILTSLFAGLYPAWRASKEVIVKAIWGE